MNLPIFEKTYELLLWLFPHINKFPKHQRYVLGQQLQNTALTLLLGIVWANQMPVKLPHLLEMSRELDKLRILLRLAKDLRFISIRQYQFAAELCNEVGRMLGGWIKAETERGRQAG